MASLVENVFTLARGSFLLWTPKTLRNLLRFSKYFNNPLDRVTIFSLFYTYIFYSVISNHQRKYRKGHVFSKPRTFLIKHPEYPEYPVPWNYFSTSCIPITFSSNIPYPGNFFGEYPVSRKTLIGPHFWTWCNIIKQFSSTHYLTFFHFMQWDYSKFILKQLDYR